MRRVMTIESWARTKWLSHMKKTEIGASAGPKWGAFEPFALEVECLAREHVDGHWLQLACVN